VDLAHPLDQRPALGREQHRRSIERGQLGAQRVVLLAQRGPAPVIELPADRHTALVDHGALHGRVPEGAVPTGAEPTA
jgi:hypothetical protein